MAFDKVVDSAELDATFTAIADAIRSKTGDTAGLTHDQMPVAIAGIQGGGGVPMIETGATDKISNLILVDVHFPGGMANLGGQTLFSYNGIIAPGIPCDISSACQYISLFRSKTSGAIYIYGSTSKPYYTLQDGVDRYELPTGRYRAKLLTNVWGNTDISTNATYCNLTETWEVFWTNFDVPNGSANATEIYFDGSEPVLVE